MLRLQLHSFAARLAVLLLFEQSFLMGAQRSGAAGFFIAQRLLGSVHHRRGCGGLRCRFFRSGFRFRSGLGRFRRLFGCGFGLRGALRCGGFSFGFGGLGGCFGGGFLLGACALGGFGCGFFGGFLLGFGLSFCGQRIGAGHYHGAGAAAGFHLHAGHGAYFGFFAADADGAALAAV